MNNTVQAISLSHKKVIRWAKENKLPEIFVGEDDILFTSLNSYRYFVENKPEDYDVYFGGIYGGVQMPDGNWFGIAGMTIYSVASRFYDKFLSAPDKRNIDKALAGMGKFVVSYPLVAKQRNGYSFHRKKEVNDDRFLIGRKFLTDHLPELSHQPASQQ